MKQSWLDAPWYPAAFMVTLAAIFGAGVTGVHLATRGILERNQRVRFETALVEVFGLADTPAMDETAVHALVEKRVEPLGSWTDPETGLRLPVYRAWKDDARTQPAGIGFRFRGLGFWAPIEGILALTPDTERTLGLVILQQTETPGLGGRVAEPVFTQQFRKGVVVVPPLPDGRCVTLYTPGMGARSEHAVDAITGATRTSLAMERILNRRLAAFFRARRDAKTAGERRPDGSVRPPL